MHCATTVSLQILPLTALAPLPTYSGTSSEPLAACCADACAVFPVAALKALFAALVIFLQTST